MARPIPLRILDEIESRLANIKIANGYQRTLAGVRRATLKGFQSADLPMANFWTGTDEVTSRGGAFVERRLSLVVEVYDLTRDRPFVDVVFEMADDVIVALHRATATPAVTDIPEQQFGGILASLQLVSVTPQIGEGQSPWCGAMLSFSALYRTRTDGVTLANP